ncbi:MAG: hypothetical protein ACRES7_07970 [Gammaproteobacteria bacterium]
MSLERILARPEVGLDMQMLFDLLEEQLHLPAAAIEVGKDAARNKRGGEAFPDG